MKYLLPFALLLCGCVPTQVGLGSVHVSQPLRGAGPPPFGNHSASSEMNYEAVEGFARWEGERSYIETDVAFVVHDSNLVGGPWIFTIRGGWKMDILGSGDKR